ncbi:proline rich transmembrane protein 1B-like [Scleropages formosus]|uniref:proline rich transmembrane protein 1B-like n=1 Tax=Scleropages formosus TaxID=113540 RepID=UPI0010FA8289|nr:proline rich transmembrane protein 1B-like [Scleropages formosus]
MDSSKISGVPPPDWNPDSKAGMAYPPPPYQDQPQYPNQVGYYPAPQYGGAPQGPPYPQGPQPTVTVQPTVYVTRAPLAHPLPDYLGYSIFTMLCCCLPLGIAALIYSISTRDANNQGHLEMAKRNSRLARNLNHAGLGIGIAIFVLWIIFVLFLSAK